MPKTPSGHVQVINFDGFFDSERLPHAERLRKLFGDRARVWADECRDPYIPCSRLGGQIFIYSKARIGLHIFTKKPNLSFGSIKAVCPSVEMTQEGEGEAVLTILDADARALAGYARPRMMIGEEAREARREIAIRSGGAERLARYRGVK